MLGLHGISLSNVKKNEKQTKYLFCWPSQNHVEAMVCWWRCVGPYAVESIFTMVYDPHRESEPNYQHSVFLDGMA